jgi:hypothetical protein
MGAGTLTSHVFRNFEYRKEYNRERQSRDGCNFFAKEIDCAERYESQCSQRPAERDFGFANVEIQRNAIFTLGLRNRNAALSGVLRGSDSTPVGDRHREWHHFHSDWSVGSIFDLRDLSPTISERNDQTALRINRPGPNLVRVVPINSKPHAR